MYKDDINNLHTYNEETIYHINSNLNQLAKLLKTLNIKLYFMPASDKYNTYHPYIIATPYGKSNLFSLFATLPKIYYFVNTEKILQDQLRQQTIDLYYSDDTHWSFKANKAIANAEIFKNIMLP